MNSLARNFAFLCAGLLSLPLAAQDAGKAADFKPFQLVGEWKFVNLNTGVNYGGAIEIDVNGIDGKGIMKGKISYDGRQTNDKCSTKTLFSDQPVEAEIIKANADYRVTFQVPCATGASPRIFSWTLVCDANGLCSQPTVLPHGKGATFVKERK